MITIKRLVTKTLFIPGLHKFNKNGPFPKICFERFCNDDSRNNQDRDKSVISSAISSKYQVFRDEDSSIILDVDEERLKYRESIEEHRDQKKEDEFIGLSLQRGTHGVYDIEDLVQVLRREKLEDIFVVTLPQDINYVDYIVVVTGKSFRHMSAVTQFIRKLYKRKKNPSDIIPKIEGENSKEWMALDLGNIALHIFSRQARLMYDLESLWSVGSQFDTMFNKPEDPFVALLQKHSVYLGDLQPADRAG